MNDDDEKASQAVETLLDWLDKYADEMSFDIRRIEAVDALHWLENAIWGED